MAMVRECMSGLISIYSYLCCIHTLDLRQDMLTLQVMSIMDNLWRQSGLDLRLFMIIIIFRAPVLIHG